MDLQTNCSELVTHLGMEDRRDIIEALKKINDNAGNWKLALVLDNWKEKLIIPIPTELMEQAISIGETEDGKDIYIRDIMDYLWKFVYWKMPQSSDTEKTSEYDRIKNLMANKQLDRANVWKSIRLMKDCPNDIKFIPESERYNLTYVRVSMGDGYCQNNTLTIGCSQHCCVNEFPAFHRARELFDDAEFHSHDGGSTIDYEQWMNYWFSHERGFTHHSYRSGPDTDGMEVEEHEMDETFRQFPPLERTTTVGVPDRSVPDRHQKEIDRIFTEGITPKKKKVDTKRKLGE